MASLLASEAEKVIRHSRMAGSVSTAFAATDHEAEELYYPTLGGIPIAADFQQTAFGKPGAAQKAFASDESNNPWTRPAAYWDGVPAK